MPTIVDSVVTKIGWETKDFESGYKKIKEGLDNTVKQANISSKEMEIAGKRAASFFVQVRNSALAFFAVLTTGRGISSFTSQIVNAGADLQRLAANLNTSASGIAQWSNLAELSGGSAQAFQNTLRHLSQAAYDLGQKGASSMDIFWKRANINPLDAERHMRPYADILLEISDWAAKQADRPTTVNILKDAGIDEGTINLIMKGREELKKGIAEQAKSLAMNDRQIKKAAEAEQKWIKAKQQFAMMGREIVERLLPSIEKLIKLMLQLAESASPILIKIFELFVKINDATGGLAAKIGGLVIAFNLLGGTAIIGGLSRLAGLLASIGATAATAASAVSGVLLAGGAGYAGGTLIYDKFIKGTELSDKIGGYIAEGLAFFGNEEAKEALRINKNAASGKGAITDKDRIIKERQKLLSSLDSKYGFPAGTMDRMWAAESSRGVNLLGPATKTGERAKGHFQFMSETAKQYGVTDPMNFDQSAVGAAKYLDKLRNQSGGDLNKAIVAYNWGPGNLARKGMDNMPMESRNYLNKVGAKASTAAPVSNTNKSTNISVNTVTINTQAKDAAGIARDFTGALVAQTNYGMR